MKGEGMPNYGEIIKEMIESRTDEKADWRPTIVVLVDWMAEMDKRLSHIEDLVEKLDSARENVVRGNPSGFNF